MVDPRILPYVAFQTKTLLVPFKFLYPECSILISGEPQLHPLICLRGTCHRSRNCMEILAKRCHYFFQEIEPQAQMIISYFKVRESIKAGVFERDLGEPRFMTLNRAGFNKFKREGVIKQWPITDAFINISGFYPTPNIIPVGNLIR